MAAANAARINHAEPGPIDCVDPGTFTCRSRSSEFSNREPMVDDQVINIIKALGLEGLLWIPSREIDHGLITALVERWRPETHTFHMPHGEVNITLQDVEVLLGLLVDGEAIIGSTRKIWTERILISRLLEQVVGPLPANTEEDDLHKYTRCYILALLGDTIFGGKSGDRVHLMWVQQLEDLHNPHMYSWGSACLAWLYRELCRASDRGTSQIGGCLLLVQYWAWARFSYLCPAVEHGPPVGAYGPSVHAPLVLKWLWVPNKKNRLAHIFRDMYRKWCGSHMKLRWRTFCRGAL
nr:serine/threonine-protein phosphatase 7 long form homolog [Quercus suber]